MSFGFPEVEDNVKKMVEEARRHRVPVTREVIMSFGRVVKAQILRSDGISDTERTRIASFRASDNWAKLFVKRNALLSKVLHGEASGVDHEAVKEGIDVIREAASNYALDNIFNVDEMGLFFKVLPKRTYVAKFEEHKTVRETKDMGAKDRVSLYLCTNATGSLKVPMSMIGKAVNPRCFRLRPSPLKYFLQQKAWSDGKIFERWWMEVFLPFIEENTSGNILLMDGCKSHGALEDSSARVRVMHLPPNCTSVHQPMDMGVIAALKLRYRRRLLDRKAEQLHEVALLREETRRKSMTPGAAGLDQGFHRHMLDVATLLEDAWADVTEVSIAGCWALADILPTHHQQVVQELRKKKRDVRDSDDSGNDSSSSDEAAKEATQWIAKVRLSILVVDEETREAFKELGDMLDTLGVNKGPVIPKDALNAVVEWFNLEAQEDVARAVDDEREQEILRDIESSIGSSLGGNADSDSEETGSGRKTPQELSTILDTLDEQAKIIDRPKLHDLLRQVGEEFVSAALDERLDQSGDMEMAETIDRGC